MQGGKRNTLIRQEAILSPSMLMEKYQDKDHPIFTRAKWFKEDVNKTQPELYWAWVSNQIDDVLDDLYRPRTNAHKAKEKEACQDRMSGS